jgi:ureidoglycolate lyase
MPISPVPLTREAFIPYGQVLMALGEDTQRQEFASTLRNLRPHAALNMALILTKPSRSARRLRLLERHPFSSQSFIPIQGTRYLVIVCPSTAEGEPMLDRLTAFVAESFQAVTYNPDVWHAPHAVLGGSGTFIMLRWDVGNADDTETRRLDRPWQIDLGR